MTKGSNSHSEVPIFDKFILVLDMKQNLTSMSNTMLNTLEIRTQDIRTLEIKLGHCLQSIPQHMILAPIGVLRIRLNCFQAPFDARHSEHVKL